MSETEWMMTFAGLLADVEECVADLAQMREDDPTRPALVEDYANASRRLREHVGYHPAALTSESP